MVFLGYWLLSCHPFSPPFCPLEAEMGESPSDWYIHDAIVPSCAFSRRTEQQEVLFPSNFGHLVLLSQGGGCQQGRVL